MLAQRITEACNNVPLSHLVNVAQYSKNHFEKCLNKVPLCLKEIFYHILILDWDSQCVLIKV